MELPKWSSWSFLEFNGWISHRFISETNPSLSFESKPKVTQRKTELTIIQTIRLECKLPNVCVVDINDEETLRIVGVYASESKSWSWEDLSPFLSKRCVIYGDFNVDIEQDGKKAEMFLEWADTNFIAPFTPESPTSLRSDRVLDYALAAGLSINIQNYGGHTTSDYTPIISVIQTKIKMK